MKNFLAIDTSGDSLCVVAGKDGKIFSSFTPDCAMKHSVLLMQKIDETLTAADMTPAECDFFAAVVGAGSFTGIRIGISAMKGFALAFGKPTLPVTSFDLAAYTTIGQTPIGKGKILCLVDALHDSYYACGYEDGEVTYPPAYLSEAEVLALREKGYALRSCGKLPLEERVFVERADLTQGLINAVNALSQKQTAFGELVALYVRKSSAELTLAKENNS